MASLTRWTWVWASSGSWWWAGKPGMLWFMGLQRVRNDWVIELILLFCFPYFALKDRCKNILVEFISKDNLFVFSSRYFMVSGLKFSSSIHFYFLFFVYGTKKCSNLYVLNVVAQFFQHHLLKTLFIHCIFSLLCCILLDHRCMSLFLGSLFCSIDLCICFSASIMMLWLL